MIGTAAAKTLSAAAPLGVPVQLEPIVMDLEGEDRLVAVVDFLGEIHMLRDDGASAPVVSASQLPTGAAARGHRARWGQG